MEHKSISVEHAAREVFFDNSGRNDNEVRWLGDSPCIAFTDQASIKFGLNNFL
jgi:hypothetical protein